MSVASITRRHRVAALLLGAAAMFAIGVGFATFAGNDGEASSARADPAAALGGFRTAWVGSLFLRAEALKRQGRQDELPGLYREILRLDPTCESAVDHLADVMSRELRLTAPTPEGRVRWWVEAMSLVDDALARSPRSVRLLWRRADLLLSVADDDPDNPEADPAVAKHLRDAGRDRDREAVEALLAAARLSGDVPRIGRIHLVLIARRVPQIAAARLARGDDPDWFLRAGAEALRAREAEFSELLLGAEPQSWPAEVVLQSGLALVVAVRDALRGTPTEPASRSRAREILERYVEEFGDDRVAKALRPAVN